MNERLLKRVFSADALGLCLVAIAIQVLLYGLESAIKGTQTRNLFWICVIAAVLGLSASRSKWNGRLTSAAILVLGLIGVWILGARITEPVLHLVRSIFTLGPQLFPVITYRFDIDAHGAISSWETISLASSALIARLQTSLLGAAENFRVTDALIRNMLWTFALWLLSAWMGWFAAKRNAITALLPGAVLLTLLVWSTERRVESLWAFIMIMLLLMGIWNYKIHVQRWETDHFDYSDSIRLDMGQSIVVVAVVVGLVSYLTPSISWRDIRDYFRERQQPQETAVVTDRSNNTNTTAPPGKLAPDASLPRQHLLTSGYAQSKNIVMTVKTGELPPMPFQSQTHVPRYYWRSVVYDQYNGKGWFTTSAPPQSISATQPMIAGVLTSYKLVHMNVELQQPDGKLYWTGMLYSADIPLTVDWRLRPQSNLFATQTTLLQADMFAAHTNATSYRADAFAAVASIQQLRAAPADDYPQHIRNLYFSLPPDLPERVHHLARQITEGQPTAYDKAKAIETYLRAKYPYDLEIPIPPEDQDVVDYFLFDLKRGYCDYYATAMVVLARASGLPSRFVSGYAPGDYDVSNAQYLVRELHAHSWAEIYFPEIGWIEFEPTGNQPEIERQEINSQLAANDDSPSRTRTIFAAWRAWNIGTLLVLPAIMLLGAIIYFILVEPLLFRRLTPAAAIEILYQRLYRSARPLVGERTRAETAYEFTNKLIQNIQSLHSTFDHSSNKVQKDVADLSTLYHAALFGRLNVERHDVKHALKLWKRLRWSLVLERMRYFLWTRNKATR